MSEKEQTKKALHKILENNSEQFCIVCEVDSVDTTNLTAYCIPIEEGKADLAEVRLVADTSKVGFVRFPKVGSFVIVSFLNNEAGYIADCNDIDKVYLNGSSYDGLIKINDLLTEINNRNTTLLTAIKAALTSIDASIVALGGASVSAPAFTAATTTIINILKSQVENPSVKHGNGI